MAAKKGVKPSAKRPKPRPGKSKVKPSGKPMMPMLPGASHGSFSKFN